MASFQSIKIFDYAGWFFLFTSVFIDAGDA
jgi:hypothetical protein